MKRSAIAALTVTAVVLSGCATGQSTFYRADRNDSQRDIDFEECLIVAMDTYNAGIRRQTAPQNSHDPATAVGTSMATGFTAGHDLNLNRRACMTDRGYASLNEAEIKEYQGLGSEAERHAWLSARAARIQQTPPAVCKPNAFVSCTA